VIEEDYAGLAATEERVRPMAVALGQTQSGPDIQHATILRCC